MALKKSQLYSSLWSSCDELRGGMDASQYKDYVLTLLFLKYVSDKYAGDPEALIDVPAGGGFADIVKLKGDKEIGDGINKVIGRLAAANNLQGVIDVADFNDPDKLGRGREMQDRLTRLVGIFQGLDFGTNRAEGDDLLGDAYEYLMRHFATESGKSKGQFYTPAEVSRIMAKVVGIGPTTPQDETIYDPTCGSGSLLLKAADEAPRGLTIYGQEMDNATWALACMNMILHGHPTADLWQGNTLASPHFKNETGGLKTFDYAVANPPFSTKAWTNGFDPEHDEFHRFEDGLLPPTKNGDYAFLLHIVKSLKSDGKGAIILPHGVLFRGNKEADIRRSLLQRGLIKGVIGLPPNLFYGTGIPACIIVIDKEQAHARTGVFMVDSSKGFAKDGNKNRLRDQDIHKIVDIFTTQVASEGYARMVPLAEIASPENDYNLNIPRYIDSRGHEDLQDIAAHIYGDIPDRDIDALAQYWHVFPSIREELFQDADRPGYSRAKVRPEGVESAIRAHPEYQEYASRVAAVFRTWQSSHDETLLSVDRGAAPRAVIELLSEDLLGRFSGVPLLSRYDVYQGLMDFWADTMQDDLYQIAADGWIEAATPRPTIDDPDRRIRETPDLVLNKVKYKMDLIPPDLIVQRFFPKDRELLAALEAAHDEATAALEEIVAQSGADEDGPLEAARTESGSITKASISARLRAVGDNVELAEEKYALTRCLTLIDAEALAARAIKEARAALAATVLASYNSLTEDEIKNIVVRTKWFGAIQRAIDDEVHDLTTRLSGRLQQIEERYAETLPQLEARISTLNERVNSHLRRMGIASP